jgi:hypothetical protein
MFAVGGEYTVKVYRLVVKGGTLPPETWMVKRGKTVAECSDDPADRFFRDGYLSPVRVRTPAGGLPHAHERHVRFLPHPLSARAARVCRPEPTPRAIAGIARRTRPTGCSSTTLANEQAGECLLDNRRVFNAIGDVRRRTNTAGARMCNSSYFEGAAAFTARFEHGQGE